MCLSAVAGHIECQHSGRAYTASYGRRLCLDIGLPVCDDLPMTESTNAMTKALDILIQDAADHSRIRVALERQGPLYATHLLMQRALDDIADCMEDELRTGPHAEAGRALGQMPGPALLRVVHEACGARIAEMFAATCIPDSPA